MIDVRKLILRFGQRIAVDGVDLSARGGEVLGLVGPNGAGKTSIMSCMIGLRRPCRGRVIVAGVDVIRHPAAVRARIGWVPQELSVYPSLSVIDNLRIFAGVHGLRGAPARSRIGWALDVARLEERSRDRVARLSSGMQRRLNLVCGLLHDPAVVLCDEPVVGVDAQSRNHIFATLRELAATGKTLVYTSHQVGDVEALCDRVVILDRGRVVRSGEPRTPGGPAPSSRRMIVELELAASPHAVDDALRAAGLAPSRVQSQREDLEAAYLRLTGDGLRDGPR